jgi:hypothetical protein
MLGACITHGRDEKCIANFGWKIRNKRPLGRPKRRWRVILRYIFGKYGGKV